MAVCRLVAIGLVISGFAASAVRAAPAEPSPVAQGVSELLQLGQRYSPRNLAEARKQHERLSTLDGYDARAEYAYAVILIRQRASDDALAALDRVLAERPDLLPAWRAKVWTQMLARKHAAAVVSMRAAAKVLADADPNAFDAGERAEIAGFFGRVFAYLESRTASPIPADQLRKAKQNVQSRLGDARDQFAAGEEAMVMLLADSEQQVKRSEAAKTAEVAEQEAAIRQQQKKVDQAAADIDFESEKLEVNAKTRLANLSKQVEAVQKNIIEAQFRLRQVDITIDVQQKQLIVQDLALANRANLTPAQLADVQFRRTAVVNNLQQLASLRVAAVAQVLALNNQVAQFGEEREALLNEDAQSARQLKSQAAQLKYKERKLDRVQKSAAAAAAHPAGKTRLVAQRQQVFGACEPFPFQAEAMRVTGWFRH